MKDDSNIHKGHRERMRQRFSHDAQGLNDHEILEMLLFHVFARKNTNDLSHCLIEQFGSLPAVLEASEDALCSVDGVGEKAAHFLSLLGETARRYTVAKLAFDEPPAVYDTAEKIAAFLMPKFLGQSVERAFVLLFDNGMHLVDCFHVGDGSASKVLLSTRMIAERAFSKHAVAAVLAHNHPHGIAVPSKEDFDVTGRIEEALRLIDVTLLDHFIFSDRSYTPMLQSRRLHMKENGDFAASSLLDVLKTSKKEKS